MLIKCTNAEPLGSLRRGRHRQGRGRAVPCFTHVPETGTSPVNTATSSQTHRSTGRLTETGDPRWRPQTPCGRCLGSPSPFAAHPRPLPQRKSGCDPGTPHGSTYHAAEPAQPSTRGR